MLIVVFKDITYFSILFFIKGKSKKVSTPKSLIAA